MYETPAMRTEWSRNRNLTEADRDGGRCQATDFTCTHKLQPISFDKVKPQKRSVSQFSNEGSFKKCDFGNRFN